MDNTRPTRQRHPKRVNTWALVTAGVGMVLAVTIGAGLALLPTGDHIAQGVSAMGINLGGMPRAQAATVIEQAAQRASDRQVTLVAGKTQRALTLAELGINVETDRALHDAYAVGREGTLPARVLAALQTRRTGLMVESTFALDEARTDAVVKALATRVDEAPRNATGHWTGGQVTVTPERAGTKLNVAESTNLVKRDVLARLEDGEEPATSLTLPCDEQAPHVTAAQFAGVDTVLGTFSTSFSTSTEDRASNVTTAAKAIDGTVILPGEEFSFNETVGPRTAKSGFRTAPVIIDGQLKPGMGGGVCQVSTTLYNAALFANLKIVQRSHHSLPIHYAPPGRDATVAWPSLDLKFRNTTSGAVIIDMQVNGRQITARIIGRGPAPTVSIESSAVEAIPPRTVTKNDPTLPKGTRAVEKKGSAGKSVTITRVVGTGPDAVREVLSRDHYNGEPTVVRVGTGAGGETPPPAPTAPAN